MTPTERKLANLRPASRDPALASAMGKAHGFGSGKHKQCAHVRPDGTQCRAPAAYGTPKCVRHGARRYAGTPPSPNRDANRAIEAMRGGGIPADLQRTAPWRATLAMRWTPRVMAQAGLVTAWHALQNGNPEPWRNLTKP